MISKKYVSAMSRKETGETVAAETPGWQLQFFGYKSGSGTIFKVVDIRDNQIRITDPMAPSRRVWEISFNPKSGCAGKLFLTLHDFYPDIAVWAVEEMKAYCAQHGVNHDGRGRPKKSVEKK